MDTNHPLLPPRIEYSDLVKINRYWESEEHIRPVWKLYWNRTYGASLVYDGKNINLVPESLFLIAPMTNYVPRCREETEHFYIHFTLPSQYGSMPGGIWDIPTGSISYGDIREACLKGFNRFSHTLMLYELVSFALRHLPEGFFEQTYHNPLGDLFIWLDRNLDGDCSNPVLSELTGFSDDTLRHMFLKITGLSPQKYIRNLRISRGANLLKQTDRTIEEITDLCGFYDRAHFHRLFRERTGLTPAAFRKKAGGQNAL